MGQRETFHFHSMAPDLMPADTVETAWNTALNVVFRNGETVAAGVDALVMDSATIVPKALTYVEPFDQGFWVYADETGVFANDGTDEFDITPVNWATQGPNGIFTATVTNGLACVNSSTGDPAYWDGNTSNIMLPLPDWPSGGRCLALRAHKNFLMAIGMVSEGGQRVRWSTAAEAGTIPDSWTPLASNQAGFLDLAPMSSSCLDGVALNDDLVIYKRESTWRMVFVGGNDIFAVQKSSAEQGCAATNGVGRGPDDRHLVLTSAGDIALFDGIEYRSILSGRAERVFYEDFSEGQSDLYSVFTLNREKLGGVIYPRAGGTNGTRILFYDYDSGDISFRDCDDVLCSATGRFLQDVGDANEWDGDPDAWDTDTSSWNQTISAQTVEDVLLGTLGGIRLLGGGEFALDVMLEKSGLQFATANKRKMIDRIWPKFVGVEGDVVSFRLGGQETADGPTTLTPSLPYVIGSGLPIDAFIQGRYLTLLLDSVGTSAWRLGSIDLETREVGGW